MSSFASGIWRSFQQVPRLAIAGITAALLGLPSAAGATFSPATDASWGDSSSHRDASLTFRDYHADFVERAARDFDCDLPSPPSLVDSFEHPVFGALLRAGPPADGLPIPEWLDDRPAGGRGLLVAAMALRHYCPIKPPPAVPEPGTAALLAGGLVALSLWRRRRRT